MQEDQTIYHATERPCSIETRVHLEMTMIKSHHGQLNVGCRRVQMALRPTAHLCPLGGSWIQTQGWFIATAAPTSNYCAVRRWIHSLDLHSNYHDAAMSTSLGAKQTQIVCNCHLKMTPCVTLPRGTSEGASCHGKVRLRFSRPSDGDCCPGVQYPGRKLLLSRGSCTLRRGSDLAAADTAAGGQCLCL